MRADRPASSMSVATVLRKLCELMSGTPSSSPVLRHCGEVVGVAKCSACGREDDGPLSEVRRTPTLDECRDGERGQREHAAACSGLGFVHPDNAVGLLADDFAADGDRSGVGVEVASPQRKQFGAA